MAGYENPGAFVISQGGIAVIKMSNLSIVVNESIPHAIRILAGHADYGP